MSQVIGQVWREVVGCRNWPVMRVPQFIALRRNDSTVASDNGLAPTRWQAIIWTNDGKFTNTCDTWPQWVIRDCSDVNSCLTVCVCFHQAIVCIRFAILWGNGFHIKQRWSHKQWFMAPWLNKNRNTVYYEMFHQTKKFQPLRLAVLSKHKYMFAVSIISHLKGGTDGWNVSSWNAKVHFIQFSQYHGHWCLGDARGQAIGSHSIELILPGVFYFLYQLG